MKAILKQELKRAFTSWGFFLAVLLGAVLAVSHIFMFVIPQASQLEAYMEADKPMLYPGWLFSVWLGGNSYSVQSFLLLLLIPFLAVLPFGDSFFTDVTRGFAKNIYIRVNRKSYILSKLAAVFLSGGTAVIFPYALNFLVSALFLPSLKPEPATALSAISESSMLGELYYSQPFLYLALYAAVIFAFGGLFAASALAFSYIFEYRIVVMLAPFLLNLFVFSLSNLTSSNPWAPAYFLNPSYSEACAPAIFTEMFLLALFTAIGFVYRGIRNDVF